MANTLLNSDIILNESLDVLHNNLAFSRNVNRQYDKSFKSYGAAGKNGTTLKVRMPNQYTVREGNAISVQDTTQTTKTITCDSLKGVDISFTTSDLTMKIEEFSKQFIQPAMKRLASNIDATGLALYKDIYNQVGTAGTTPASAQVYLDGGAKMSDYAAPLDSRNAIINPKAQARTVDGLKSLLNSASAIGQQYTKGVMGEALGFKFGMDQNVQRLTTGSRAGTILVDGSVTAEGSSTIHVDGLSGATQTFKAGEIITVAGVNGVNPETKADTGELQQFVITADATASGNEVDLSVSPSMYTSASGVSQTVTALPADGAAITVSGSASTAYPINMLFHPDAFALVTADLELPGGVDFASRGTSDGISMRIIRQYDINNDAMPCRIDILSGWTTMREEYACRLIG